MAAIEMILEHHKRGLRQRHLLKKSIVKSYLMWLKPSPSLLGVKETVLVAN